MNDQLERDIAIHRDGKAGVLNIEGSDALDFLNRSVTNQLSGMEEGQSRRTLFLTPEGRTRTDMYVIHEGDSLKVVSESSTELAEFWKDNIFIEDVEIEETDLRKKVAYDREPEELQGLVADDPDLTTYPTPLGTGVLSVRDEEIFSDDLNVDVVDGDEAEILRVERGVPSFGKELEDRIPLEAGMYDVVDFEKGCYVGQEVVARIEDRGGGPDKGLSGFAVTEDAEEGDSLHRDGDVVGELTSVVESPREGWIALGFLDEEHAEEGTDLKAGIEDSSEAVVRELPFVGEV
ncbi:MAG: folate-binding protein YgfZ [Halobacteria archaeon]